MTQRKRVELWDGWIFDGKYIYDAAGNKYDENMIRAAFYGEQLYQHTVGNTGQISVLKKSWKISSNLLRLKSTLNKATDKRNRKFSCLKLPSYPPYPTTTPHTSGQFWAGSAALFFFFFILFGRFNVL